MSDLEKNYLLDESMVLYQHKDHFHFNTDTKLLAQFMQVKRMRECWILEPITVLFY